MNTQDTQPVSQLVKEATIVNIPVEWKRLYAKAESLYLNPFNNGIQNNLPILLNPDLYPARAVERAKEIQLYADKEDGQLILSSIEHTRSKIEEINSHKKPQGILVQELLMLKAKIDIASDAGTDVEVDGKHLTPKEAMALFYGNVRALEMMDIIPFGGGASFLFIVDSSVRRLNKMKDKKTEAYPSLQNYKDYQLKTDSEMLEALNWNLALGRSDYVWKDSWPITNDVINEYDHYGGVGIHPIDQYLTDVMLHSPTSLVNTLMPRYLDMNIEQLKDIMNKTGAPFEPPLHFAANVAFYLKDFNQREEGKTTNPAQRAAWTAAVEEKLQNAINNKERVVLFGSPPNQRELNIRHTVYYLNACRLFAKVQPKT